MRCKHCAHRSDEGNKRQRSTRRRSCVAICEQCGAAILTVPRIEVGTCDGTLAQLARFGLAITGEPLLEFKHEGI